MDAQDTFHSLRVKALVLFNTVGILQSFNHLCRKLKVENEVAEIVLVVGMVEVVVEWC